MSKSFIILNVVFPFWRGGCEATELPVTSSELQQGTYKAVAMPDSSMICPSLPTLEEFTMEVKDGVNGQMARLTAKINGRHFVMDDYSPLVWYAEWSLRIPGNPKCMYFPRQSFHEEWFVSDIISWINLKAKSTSLLKPGLAFCFEHNKLTGNMGKIAGKWRKTIGYSHSFELVKEPSMGLGKRKQLQSSPHSSTEEPPKKRGREQGTAQSRDPSMSLGYDTMPLVTDEGMNRISTHKGGDTGPGPSGNQLHPKSLHHPSHPLRVNELQTGTATDNALDLEDIDVDNWNGQPDMADEILDSAKADSIVNPSSTGMSSKHIGGQVVQHDKSYNEILSHLKDETAPKGSGSSSDLLDFNTEALPDYDSMLENILDLKDEAEQRRQ
ncbi:hypothetical protein FOL47_009349 [Perkinsus chesapeaki]|uniref:Uncharacterized protein n=1 Tax=Perkinsus chesapeaki TaxID=330153 RepID=A0A7J6L8S8_PERCH|nr:hypothetical protein FOL47_009349 [Perkinsus chesapeaki]